MIGDLKHKMQKAAEWCLKKSKRILSRELPGGFTLIELMVVIAVLGTLTSVAIPSYQGYIEKAKITRTIAEIRIMQMEIAAYQLDRHELPDTLDDIGRGNLLDPWKNNYQYLNFANVVGVGKMRKDHFQVPLNTDYDLYSMGKDRASDSPLTAEVSHDDIIRANDGRFIGLAWQY